MDRQIQKKFWTGKKIGWMAFMTILVLGPLYLFVFSDKSSRLFVDSERLTIATVKAGAFQEWIPTNGSVMPIKTVYLNAMEGGRVEELYVEEGAFVTLGQPILRLSNTNLELDIMYREAELFQHINELRNTRLAMDQHRLELTSSILDLDYQISLLHRQVERSNELAQNKLISNEEYTQTKEEYQYLQARRALTLENHQQDSLFRQIQIESLESSVKRMQSTLEIVKRKLENLTVSAPITGQLSSLNAEVGQAKNAGVPIGQIDVLDGFKVRCAIDEHYITRIANGQTGTFDYAGESFKLELIKVYPEVREGRFEVDMGFLNETPEGIRRGQTLRIQLELGAPAEAILVPRGGFYQSTGGRWAFVLSESGDFAVRRPIRLGRKNTLMFEVLEGLEPGERVITSSYDNFGEVDKLILRDHK